MRVIMVKRVIDKRGTSGLWLRNMVVRYGESLDLWLAPFVGPSLIVKVYGRSGNCSHPFAKSITVSGLLNVCTNFPDPFSATTLIRRDFLDPMESPPCDRAHSLWLHFAAAFALLPNDYQDLPHVVIHD